MHLWQARLLEQATGPLGADEEFPEGSSHLSTSAPGSSAAGGPEKLADPPETESSDAGEAGADAESQLNLGGTTPPEGPQPAPDAPAALGGAPPTDPKVSEEDSVELEDKPEPAGARQVASGGWWPALLLGGSLALLFAGCGLSVLKSRRGGEFAPRGPSSPAALSTDLPLRSRELPPLGGGVSATHADGRPQRYPPRLEELLRSGRVSRGQIIEF
jgi:hypothetical protein